MATRESYSKLTLAERQNRYFSEAIKRKIVSELDRKIVTISEISREYQVSRTSVQKWIYKYSPLKKKGRKMVVESESDAKKIAELKAQIKQLEQAVGQKQIKIDFLEKMIELTEEDLKIDIKKKGKA
jgi:transposase-like protein